MKTKLFIMSLFILTIFQVFAAEITVNFIAAFYDNATPPKEIEGKVYIWTSHKSYEEQPSGIKGAADIIEGRINIPINFSDSFHGPIRLAVKDTNGNPLNILTSGGNNMRMPEQNFRLSYIHRMRTEESIEKPDYYLSADGRIYRFEDDISEIRSMIA